MLTYILYPRDKKKIKTVYLGSYKIFSFKTMKRQKRYKKRKYSEQFSLDKFNRDYGTDITFQTVDMDLMESNWFGSTFSSKYILRDLSRMTFNLCNRVSVPQKCLNIHEFKPKMINLKILDLSCCEIKKLELDPKYFLNLETIDLSDNLITYFSDIEILKNFPKLKWIYLYDNPIIKNNKELFKMFDCLNKVMIIFK